MFCFWHIDIWLPVIGLANNQPIFLVDHAQRFPAMCFARQRPPRTFRGWAHEQWSSLSFRLLQLLRLLDKAFDGCYKSISQLIYAPLSSSLWAIIMDVSSASIAHPRTILWVSVGELLRLLSHYVRHFQWVCASIFSDILERLLPLFVGYIYFLFSILLRDFRYNWSPPWAFAFRSLSLLLISFLGVCFETYL